MRSIIVVNPNKNTALQLRNFLEDYGLYVSHICATGASALGIAADMRGGVIVCASMLKDMSAKTLAQRLPANFDIVAITKNGREDYIGNMVSLPLPLDKDDFLNTVEILVATDSAYTSRSTSEEKTISQAKDLLMKAHSLTEMQAHKRLQQESMNDGVKLIDTAKKIIAKYS